MNALVENIIKTAPITFDDNYKTRLDQRRKVLMERRDKLNPLRSRGTVEYDSNGMAARFYPAIHYRKDFKRLGEMIKAIDNELYEIDKYL